MDEVTITSSRIKENGIDKELCKISLEDFNRLTNFALSLEPTEEDNDISMSTTYCNALERFFREKSTELSDLREIYNNIKDDMIVRMLFIENIELALLRTNISDDKESYDRYIAKLEEFKKSIAGNEFQKQDHEFDSYMGKTI